MITKNLAKAKKDNLVVRLYFGSGKGLTCKVVKLSGTEAEVTTNKIDRRKIIVNTLTSVIFIDEQVNELA